MHLPGRYVCKECVRESRRPMLALCVVFLFVCWIESGHAAGFVLAGAEDTLSSADSYLDLTLADDADADSAITDTLEADSAHSSTEDSLTINSSQNHPRKTRPLVQSNIVGWTTEPVADRKRQSPGAALLKSAFVPGLGQLGNRKYLKAALIIGGETYLFLRWLDFRNQTVNARAAFERVDDLTLRRQLFSEFDTVRDKRNFYAWLTGTLIFASMIDAFVDAHLAKFPSPDKNLSLKLSPSLSDSEPMSGFGARVIWRF